MFRKLILSFAVLLCGALVTAPGKPVVGGLKSPDGSAEVITPLPSSEKKHNKGGSDGAGLCVFTSIEYAARWQNEAALFDLQDYMRKYPGGGYPEKVASVLKKHAPGVHYLQSTSGDIEVIKAAFATGRMPCVTYDGHDPHYRGTIAHMVAMDCLTDKWAAITDNNFPGDDQHVWMTPEDFMQRWRGGGGGGWVVVLLAPPPPPVPHN